MPRHHTTRKEHEMRWIERGEHLLSLHDSELPLPPTSILPERSLRGVTTVNDIKNRWTHDLAYNETPVTYGLCKIQGQDQTWKTYAAAIDYGRRCYSVLDIRVDFADALGYQVKRFNRKVYRKLDSITIKSIGTVTLPIQAVTGAVEHREAMVWEETNFPYDIRFHHSLAPQLLRNIEVETPLGNETIAPPRNTSIKTLTRRRLIDSPKDAVQNYQPHLKWLGNFASDLPERIEPAPLKSHDSLGNASDQGKRASGCGTQDEVAFTDSGYASVPNVNRWSLAKPSIGLGQNAAFERIPTTTNDMNNNDTGTLYSFGTTIAPNRAQTCVAEICNDIYNELSDCVETNTWIIVSKALPELIKAFAIKLGNNSRAQVNRDIMYFIHKRHREIIAQLEGIFSHAIDDQSLTRKATQGMALLDKMTLWQSKNSDGHTRTADEDLFQGVNDEDDDDPIDESSLSSYHKTIFQSPAYEWFLTNCRKEFLLQWEESRPRTMVEKIRRKLLNNLPTGAISKRYPPVPHEVIFVLAWNPLMGCRLENENTELESWPAHSLPAFASLTGSPKEAQAMTIKQYMNQTWPTNGTKMLDAIQNAIATVKKGEGKNLAPISKPHLNEVPTHEQIAVEVGDTTLSVRVKGPPYFVAECGEQLAWLLSVLGASSRNLIQHREPSIIDMNVRDSAPPNAIYRVEFEIVFTAADVISLDSPAAGIQNSWQTFVGGHTLIRGYPISRRPRGYPGLELSLDMLLYLTQAKGVCISDERILIIGLKRTLKLVKQVDNVFLWHPASSTTLRCFCDQTLAGEYDFSVKSNRHILGSCESLDLRPEEEDSSSTNAGSLQNEGSESNGAVEIHSLSVPAVSSQLAEFIGGHESESVLDTYQSEKLARDRLSHRVEDRAKAGSSSSSEIEFLGNHCYFQFMTETESEDVSLDTDLLSISESAEEVKLLDVNDPLYPVLIHVLDQLLSGFRSLTQQPCDASGSGQGTNMPTSALGSLYSSANSPQSQRHLKKKRSGDDGDGDGEDGCQGPPRKKPNCITNDARKKSFACPYLKRDPLKHHNCCTKQLSRVRDVKQHLSRRHTPEQYCPICLKTDFTNQESWQEHITERTCPSRDPSLLEGVSYNQRQQLRKKSDSSLSEEGQWFAIWEIIFPRCPKPSSVYLDVGFSTEMRLFSEYSYVHGPALLRQQIISNSDWTRPSISEEERQQVLDQVITEGIRCLFESWRSDLLGISRPSRLRMEDIQPAIQGTPMSSMADSGVLMGNRTSYSETESQISGFAHPSSMAESVDLLTATTDGVEGQTSSMLHVNSEELFQVDDEAWFQLLLDKENSE